MSTHGVCFRFLMVVQMGNRSFPPVECSNKKDGRKDAAEKALRQLMAEGVYHTPSQQPVSSLLPLLMSLDLDLDPIFPGVRHIHFECRCLPL